MQTYELTYIIADSVTDNKTPEVMQEVAKELERLAAVVIKEEAWGKRKLAYPIKKSVFGTYVTLQAHLEGVRVKEVDHFLQLHPTVIRHLLITLQPQTVKVTDEAELSQALDKRVEEKITHKEEAKAPAPLKAEESTQAVAAETAEPKAKSKRKVTKSSNEEEKKQESAEERKKLVEKKLSEILGEE